MRALAYLLLVVSFITTGSLRAKAFDSAAVDLSSRKITSLEVDHRGAVWVGTDEGLNLRASGRTYKFYADITNKHSLLDSDIESLTTTPDGTAVALSASGLSFFNESAFNFTQAPLDSEPTGLFFDPIEFQYWATTEKAGIALLNRDMSHSATYKTDPLNPLSISTSSFEVVTQQHFDFSNEEKIYVATKNGFNIFDRAKKTFKRFFKREGSPLLSSHIRYLHRLNPSTLLVITDKGINSFDTIKQEFDEQVIYFDVPILDILGVSEEHFLLRTSNKITLVELNWLGQPSLSIRRNLDVGFDRKITTQGENIFIWSEKELQVFNTQLKLENTYYLPSRISSVQASGSRIVVGTSDGLEIINSEASPVSSKPAKELLFFENTGRHLVQVFKGYLKVTEARTRIDNITYFADELTLSPSDNFAANDDYVFIVSNNSMHIFSISSGTEVIVGFPVGIEGAPVSNLKVIENEIFLSSGNGVQRLVLDTNQNSDSEDQRLFQKNEYFEFNPLLNKDIPRSFSDIAVINNQVWITSKDFGLSIHERNLNIQIKNFQYSEGDLRTLASNSVEKIVPDIDKNLIYLSTKGEGLFVYDMEAEIFSQISTKERLLSNNIYDLLLDSEGTLWILTGDGVNYFRDQTVLNVSVEDGFTVTSYLDSAMHEIDGKIRIVSSNLYQTFDPLDIYSDPAVYQLYVARVIGLDNLNQSYPLPVDETHTIEIPHEVTGLKVELFSDQTHKERLIHYAYNRGGLGEEIFNGNNQTVEVFSLPFYETTISFSSFDSYGTQNANDLSLTVIRRPPWWLRYEIFVAYLLMTMVLIAFVVRYRERRQKEFLESQRKTAELEEAKALQLSLLPKTLPNDKSLEISAYLRSANEVGGDYYDFYPSPSGLFAICGDATGHGVISGIMVSVTKAGLNGIALSEPGEILHKLNLIVKRVNFGRLRMSLNIAKVCESTVQISSAAMPPLFLYSSSRNETVEILEANLPLGGLSTESFGTQEFPFNTNDVLVMVSDGLPELPNSDGELLGYRKIYETIEEVSATGSAEVVKNALVALSRDWSSEDCIPDDITIVVIKRLSQS